MKLPSLTAAAAVLSHFGTQVLARNCINTAFGLIPTCAQTCILAGAPSVGCGGVDFECQCEKSAALFAAIDNCVSTSCPADNYQGVIDGLSLVCECIAPAVLVRQVGTAIVSGTVATYTASATISSSLVASTGTITTAPSTTSTEAGQGSSTTWTGFTSVSGVATATAVAGVAQTTPPIDIIRYLVPVAMAGAAFL